MPTYLEKKMQPVWNRLKKELHSFLADPPNGIGLGPVSDDNLLVWMGTLIGRVRCFVSSLTSAYKIHQEGSPYEGGVFFISLELPTDYPFKPPRVLFRTKVCSLALLLAIAIITVAFHWTDLSPKHFGHVRRNGFGYFPQSMVTGAYTSQRYDVP